MLEIYLLIVNLVTLVIWIMDKVRAQTHQRRIPEKTLYLLILLGGGIGALFGIAFIRHKSRHVWFWVAAIAGSLVSLYLLIRFGTLLG